ncbi:MAG: pyruvate kinase [Erysipelotrichaceae bacterium]|nr:pyruvate kinase [Erysipelotrichaceae bacterium]MBR5754648.1 pyruvate kinase [Erysipelotrichaceae bacterium]
MIDKQTKIICTLGPSSDNYDTILKMAQAGMNIVRLNFSHGTHEEHLERINLVRKVEKENAVNLGIMLDTKGPEIRLGEFKNNTESYQKGEIVTVVKEEIEGEHDRFTIRCKELFDDIRPDDYILVNDGKQKLTVLENNGEELKCRVEVTGTLSSRKGCNVPGVKLSMPFISTKDDEDIRFGCNNDVDFIAASFVRRPEDVMAIRRIITEMGKPKIQIIAKIENQEGFDNLDQILDVSDGVMVARGDLGVEIETAYVPIYQKKIIEKANHKGKAVITATHMLDSMTANPRCTRAEASDVSNAVLDGSDAVMLSAETAAGEYPVEAVATMAKIAEATEKIIPYRENLEHAKTTNNKTIQDAIGIAIADATLTLDIAAIVVFTQGGTTARRISKYRPPVPIFAVTFTKSTQGKLELYWGVKPIFSYVQNDLTNDDELASSVVKSYGIKPGSQIILSAGYPTGEGSANFMKIITVK